MERRVFSEAKRIINTPIVSSSFSRYDRIYPYTTESISSYMKDLEGKDVLSVTGSGDHYLNACYLGARSIDTFDINEFALKYLELKKAAVSKLSKEEFYDFLGNDATKYFYRLIDSLYYEDINFWSTYIRQIVPNTGLQNSNLFHRRSGIYPKRNYYMNTEGFLRLKRNLANHHNEENFIGDINELTFNKDYDSIFLSNICENQKDLDQFLDTVLRLYNKNLRDNGELYYAYYYSEDNHGIDFFSRQLPDTEIKDIPGVYRKTNKVLVLKK